MIREERRCQVCDEWYDPAKAAALPAGVCSEGCRRDRARNRARDKAARRRVPPRAPRGLFAPSSRDWTDARAKCDAEGSCRCCPPGKAGKLDAAHIVPRSLAPTGGEDPRGIVPLCRAHHQQYDAGQLDLLSVLSPAEQAYAVELAGGIIAALRVISGKRNAGGGS